MRFDLFTLYYLAVGTLLLSAGLTLWEGQGRHPRRRELRWLAAGYASIAAGCVTATLRGQIGVLLGSAISNIVIVAGYLLILHGTASLNGRSHRSLSIIMLGALAMIWAIGGMPWQGSLWSHVGSIPIALACGMTAWEVHRSPRLRALRSHWVVVAAAGGHAIFYVARAFLLPPLASVFGSPLLSAAAKLTMYEGVLYSVALPMALLALVREEAHDQLLQASRTDYLTGLGNRRWFFEKGERLLRRSSAECAVSLLAFDLDHFKMINDRHGHATGDEVLRLFARIARSSAGPDAIVSRIGGEEFVALLPGQDRIRAGEIGRAIASRFADTVAQDSRCAGVKATVSIGLAQFGPDGVELEALLSAADRALYLAKTRGRNRVELAPVVLAAAC